MKIVLSSSLSSQSKGVFDVDHPPVLDPSEQHKRLGIIAWLNLDGNVYYDKNAVIHGEISESFPEIADTIIDGGFIIDGKYILGLSTGGYSIFEDDNEAQRKALEMVERLNTSKTAPKAVAMNLDWYKSAFVRQVVFKDIRHKTAELQGEWWIVDGQVVYADGDIGDMNHETYVIEYG